MKKKLIIVFAVIAVALLLIPVRKVYEDGGTQTYTSLTEYSNASEPPFYRLRATSDFNTLEPPQTQDIVMEP